MDTQGSATAFGENVEIAASLRSLYDAKCVFLARHGEIGSVVAGDLQKDAAVRPAFVGLACRVQEARTEAEARGDFLFVADNMAKFLENFFVFGIHGNVAEDGEVVARADPSEMLFERVDKFCVTT